MSQMIDPDFGELCFDDIWTGPCEIVLYGEPLLVTLVIQTFDDDPITETQRLAFREFNSHKVSIGRAVEAAVFDHYCAHLEAYRNGFDANEVDTKAPVISQPCDLRNLVSLTEIKVMSAFDNETRQIGFIFDATFDPELGLGVLVVDGRVTEVDVQDFLLG